jgi:serine/threonine protein kinase
VLIASTSKTSKIGDVGLARFAPALSQKGVSTVMDTRLVGTPQFMDPEYMRTGHFGPKSDTFSLGAARAPGRQWPRPPFLVALARARCTPHACPLAPAPLVPGPCASPPRAPSLPAPHPPPPTPQAS